MVSDRVYDVVFGEGHRSGAPGEGSWFSGGHSWLVHAESTGREVFCQEIVRVTRF
jgi:hypothetical protein